MGLNDRGQPLRSSAELVKLLFGCSPPANWGPSGPVTGRPQFWLHPSYPCKKHCEHHEIVMGRWCRERFDMEEVDSQSDTG